MHEKYVALTPVDTADSDGYYSQAIKTALDNENILNVALTGPYGSGKSSIINSFEKKHAYKHASLIKKNNIMATFQ